MGLGWGTFTSVLSDLEGTKLCCMKNAKSFQYPRQQETDFFMRISAPLKF